MNLQYPIISRPLFKERVVVKDNTKNTISSKQKSLKKVAKNRNNTGRVNNADQHITQDVVNFINWLGNVIEEIQGADIITTINQQDNKNKVNPRREIRMIARKNARNCKSVMQRPFKISLEQEYAIAKDDDLKQMVDRIEKDDWARQNNRNIESLYTFAYVCYRKCKFINLNNMIKEIEHEEKQKEFNKMKEMQDIADWVIAARIKPQPEQKKEDIDYNDVYENSRFNMREVINVFNNNKRSK